MKNEDCTLCGLRKNCSRVIVGRGSKPAKLMIVGESPTIDEDLIGEHLLSREGFYVKNIFFKQGINFHNTYFTYTVKCFGEHKKIHRETCKFWLNKEIQEVNPHIILCLGLLPTNILTGCKKLHDVVGQEKGYNNTVIIPWYGLNKIYIGGQEIVQKTIELVERIKYRIGSIK